MERVVSAAAFIHPPRVSSDHYPLLLNTLGAESAKPRIFKFEEMWIRDPSSFIVVEDTWRKS